MPSLNFCFARRKASFLSFAEVEVDKSSMYNLLTGPFVPTRPIVRCRGGTARCPRTWEYRAILRNNRAGPIHILTAGVKCRLEFTVFGDIKDTRLHRVPPLYRATCFQFEHAHMYGDTMAPEYFGHFVVHL